MDKMIPARIYVRHPEMLSQQMRGRSHSIFAHSINIELGNGETRILLTATDTEELFPDCLYLSADRLDELHRLEIGFPVNYQSGKLCWNNRELFLETGAWSGDIRNQRCSLKMLKQTLDSTDHGMELGVPPKHVERVQRNLLGLMAAFLQADDVHANELLEQIVGLGKGLTPSTDDAIVGMLAIFYAAGNVPSCFIRSDTLTRTTDVSAKYLQCAQEGFFSQRLLNVFEASLKSQTATNDAFNRLAEWGASSGSDTIWGMKQALKAVLYEAEE